MGSYYGVCVLSQLPINWKDEVVRVFITEEVPWNDGNQAMGQVYPDDQWTPIVWPMTGTYNDCNHLNNLVIPHERLFEKSFKRMTGLELKAVNKEDNHEFLRGEQKIKHSWTRSKREDGKVGLGTALIHKSIWDFCLADQIILRRSGKDFRHTGRGYIDDCLANREKGKVLFTPMYDPYDSFPAVEYIELIHLIEDKEITVEEAYAVSDCISDMYQVQMKMDALNKSWNPSSGMGHQDCDWKLLKQFGEKIVEFAQNKLEKEEEW